MQIPLSGTSDQELSNLIRKELKNYHLADELPHETLSNCRSVIDQLETQSQPNASFAKRLALNIVLEKALAETHKENKELAILLRKRYQDRETIPDVAAHFHMSQATVSRRTDNALDALAGNFRKIEGLAWESWFNRLESRLPAKLYTYLVGVKKIEDRVIEKLSDLDGPGVVALAGIGGIGKSSLADQITRKLIRTGRFSNVGWVTFRPDNEGYLLEPNLIKAQLVNLMAQSLLPNAGPLTTERQLERLADQLKSESYLVVVDNLETQAEADEVVQYLNGMVNPSRFIITTRAKPERGTCLDLDLTELSSEDSLNLMQQYLETTGQTKVGEVDRVTLNKIYKIVGGNPLALKITAGLMQWMPLERIFLDLEKGRGDAGKIYHAIFWNTWETLSQDSRLLLQAMSIMGATTGAAAAQMQESSGLPDSSFWSAVDELIIRSMLEVRGSASSRRYAIHRLTESFIETEIINFDED